MRRQFCCGWGSYWCVLDVFMHKVLHLTVKSVCNAHDRHLWRSAEAFDAALDASTPVRINVKRDWIDDPTLSGAEIMERFESLRPVATIGPPSHPGFTISPPTLTSNSGATVSWTWRR